MTFEGRTHEEMQTKSAKEDDQRHMPPLRIASPVFSPRQSQPPNHLPALTRGPLAAPRLGRQPEFPCPFSSRSRGWGSSCGLGFSMPLSDFSYARGCKCSVTMAETRSIQSSTPLRPLRTIALRVTDLTLDSFAPYGQVIDPRPDGAAFGPHDAQLDLSRGIPRFYLMRLQTTGFQFDQITHHAKTTQCLGALNGLPWYVGVARSTIIGATERVDAHKCEEVLKGDGYEYLPPAVEDIQVFRVDGPRFLKLHAGTWHIGPMFKEPWMDFYNLELSNTNVVDHPTYNFKKNKGIVFKVDNLCS